MPGVTRIPVGGPGDGPYAVLPGADGEVWTGGGMPAMITLGPDDALWFTLNRAGALGRADVSGEVTVHPLPDPACGPVGIAADPAACGSPRSTPAASGTGGPTGGCASSISPTRPPPARTPSPPRPAAGAG